MSRATLIGTTKLDTKGWKTGIRNIKRSVRDFKRDVAQPFGDAAHNLGRVVRNATLAAGIISTLGTRETFKFEGLETQFEMLYRNTRKAKKHVKDIADLSAVTPFDVEPFMQASRLLQTMGGAALNNQKFITQMGDAAAMAGQDIAQVAEWTGRLYNDLKANIGTGRGGRMLMISGIIRPETLTKLREMTKSGVSLQERWALVSAELDRAKGSMFRLSRTGNGLLSTMRGLVKLGAAKYFKAFGDQIKNVVFKINDNLNKLYQSGTFEKWGQSLGHVASGIISKIWQIGVAYKNMNSNSRAQLNNMFLGGVAFVAAWKAGIIGPLIKGMFGLTTFLFSNFGMIISGLSILAAALGGFKLGNALYNSLSGGGKNTLQKFSLYFEGIVKLWLNTLNQMIWLGWTAGKAIFKAIAEGKNSALQYLKGELLDSFSKIIEDSNKKINNLDIYNKKHLPSTKETETWSNRFKNELAKAFSFDNMLKDFKKLVIPKALQEFIDKLNEAKKAGIKAPEMPELKPLDEQLNTKGAMDDVDKLKSKMSNVPLRGIFASLGNFKASMSPAAAVSAAKAPKHDPATKVMEKGVNLDVIRNQKLNEIKTGIDTIAAKNFTSEWG